MSSHAQRLRYAQNPQANVAVNQRHSHHSQQRPGSLHARERPSSHPSRSPAGSHPSRSPAGSHPSRSPAGSHPSRSPGSRSPASSNQTTPTSSRVSGPPPYIAIPVQNQHPSKMQHPSSAPRMRNSHGDSNSTYLSSKPSTVATGPQRSTSLGASKASMKSRYSGNSSLQQEYRDREVRGKLNAVWYGRARTPFTIAVVFFCLGFLMLIIGIGLTCARYIYQNIFLTHDKGEFIGPIFIGLSFAVAAIGIKFLYDAYKIGGQERTRLRYSASNPSQVTITTVAHKVPDPAATTVVSGSASKNALTRTPQGSRSTNMSAI